MADDDPDDTAARQALDQLYRENVARILAYALRRTADAADAADVAAETFTVAWRRIAEVPTGDAGRLWLYGVARHVLANQRRGEVRRHRLAQRLAAEIPAAAWSEQRDRPVDATDRAAVARAWAALSEPERELLTLIAWEGLSRDEVADVLGCSRGVVRVRLHRARRRFAAALRTEGVAVPGANAVGDSNGSDPGRPYTLFPEEELA